MKAGDTFVLSHPAVDRHLYVIISDPAAHAEAVVFVAMTSYDVTKEKVCMIHVGEHPNVHHLTCIAYHFAKRASLAELEELRSSGLLQDRDPVSPELLAHSARRQPLKRYRFRCARHSSGAGSTRLTSSSPILRISLTTIFEPMYRMYSNLRMVENRVLRPALTLVEVLVVLALAVTVALIFLMALPRAREQARLAGCRRNLGQIGMALALYDQFQNHLPTVGQPEAPGDQEPAAMAGAASSPLWTLLETLVLPDFTELIDPKHAPAARPGEVPGETTVPGFVCQSDPGALAGRFRAPVSYRAATGDSPAGDNGPFAPGRTFSLAAIEAADGKSYTAGFAERLVGNQNNGVASLTAYQLVPDRISPAGCPRAADTSVWRDDGGSSWRGCDYRSTLYNHALPPNGQPSCIARDGQTGFIGASSGHTRGLNMLLLDGSVSLVVPTINPKVWREFARVGGREL